MTIDLLIAIVLTASAATVVSVLCLSVRRSPSWRLTAAAIAIAWFSAIVALGATGTLAPDGLGTPGVGLVVALPVLVLAFAGLRIDALRQALLAISVHALIAANAVRVLGVVFLILHAQGRLPAPFAPIAGWGDIFIGATALPVAWMVAMATPGWRSVALAWNALGLADLVAAIALGVMSAPDSPIRAFTDGSGTSVMSVLPMLLVPGYLVPILMLTHLAVFLRLGRRAAAAGRLAAA
jgi:hypothetical protein